MKIRDLFESLIFVLTFDQISEAATTALEIDPHDGKSLLRRAQAHIYLGELVEAKNDYVTILKSPYTTTECKMAGRDGLRDMKKIVSQWKSNVAKIMTDAATQVSRG